MDRPSDMQPARAEPIRFTYEDYLAFPEDGRRHELIDGEHIVTPAPTRMHQEISGRLFAAIWKHLEVHPLGKVYYSPIDVILSDTDVVQPDIVFVSNERRDVLATWIHGAPDLAIEIVSPSSRRLDEVTKRGLFEKFGVREYWVVDPEFETVRVHRRGHAGAFVRLAELARERNEVLDTPLLPDFAVPLTWLFAVGT
jgi:Uma2 family endonuclease